MKLFWKDGTKPVGGGVVINVLYLYSTAASNPMRLNDTGNEGCSTMAAAMNAHVDVSGNTYSISEMDASVFDPSTDLVGVDVLITGSCNRIFTTGERDAIMSWLAAGGGIVTYSDNGIDGGGNDAADSRDSMGFDAILGIQAGQDQFDGIKDYTLPAGSVLGDALSVRGEGNSPWVVKDPYDISNATITELIQNHTQSPNTSGTSYTGNWVWCAIGTYFSGYWVVWGDRQITWNNTTLGGPATDFEYGDNDVAFLNSVAWAATGISQA